MAKSVGANFAIVGHSERRDIFHETDDIVNKKMKAVLARGLTAVLCVGETYQEHKAGTAKNIVRTSIKKALRGIIDFSNIIIAYEPI